MENFQAICKCAILLALLVACHGVFVIEARKMKSTEPNYSFSFPDSDVVHKDDFRPTTPGNSPGVGHSFPLDEAKSPKAPNVKQHSLTGFKDGRRPPTAPGHSPGVGHSFPLHEADVEPKAEGKRLNATHSLTGSINADRPTTPGHSPGVGHSFPLHEAARHSLTGDIDAQRPTVPGHSPGVGHSFPLHEAARHSLTGDIDAHRPTAPGHSPGVGHVLQNKNAEPNA